MPSDLNSIAPVFLVDDVKRAAEHYRDKLGFELTSYFGEPPEFTIVTRDGIKIALSRLERERGGSNRKWKETAIDAYIWVSDVEALYRQFEHSGANLLCSPVTRIYGLKEIEVRDLDGYLICFGQFV
jgi:catechol 2,3-dioxygenase-like lactoylglutathione lyase family enzyme